MLALVNLQTLTRNTPIRRVAWLCSLALLLLNPASILAQESSGSAGGEANLVLPDLSESVFLGVVVTGRSLLMFGLLIVALGLLFGLVIYNQLKNMPVHKSMLEISELIYETCKTYLVTQVKFLVILELFIGSIIVFYFGALQ